MNRIFLSLLCIYTIVGVSVPEFSQAQDSMSTKTVKGSLRQRFKNEITFGIGHWSSPELLESGVASELCPFDYRQIGQNSSNIFALAYSYRISKKISFGVFIGLQSENGLLCVGEVPGIRGYQTPALETSHFGGDGGYDFYQVGTYNKTVIPMGLFMVYVYCNSADGIVSIYGSLSFGTIVERINGKYYDVLYANGLNFLNRNQFFSSTYQSDASQNFQITPIGITIGRRFRVFFEGGFGYRGVFSCGAKFGF